MAQLKEMLTNVLFEKMIETGQDMARRCNSSTEFTEGRGRRQKRFYDEMAEDEVIQDLKTRFKVEFYFHFLDILVLEFEKLLTDFRKMTKLFSILSPKNFSTDDATNRIQDLANFYAGDVSTAERVLDEFLSFHAICGNTAQHHRSCSAIHYLQRYGKGISQHQYFVSYLPNTTSNQCKCGTQFQPPEVNKKLSLRS